MITYNVYKDGKNHILTMSYDDGQIFDLKLIEIFDKYGIRGTFHLNSGRIGKEGYVSADDIRNKFKNHEVACHTVNHPWLEKCPDSVIIKEILDDRENLEKICGYAVRGMSYPFGTHDEKVREIAKNCGIVYSRTTEDNRWFSIPRDFMQWPGTCHHKSCLEKGKYFLERIENGGKWFSGLLYVWGHSFEFDRENNWDLIEEFCKMMSGHKDIWYATNIEIYDYLQAQKSLHISVDESVIYNPTQIDVWIRKDEVVYKIPAGETVRL